LTASRSDEVSHPGLLFGTWSVSRKVIDRHGGSTLTFTGHADITESAFDEYGELEIAGGAFDSRRHYGLTMEDGHVTVRFADGRPFLRLRAGQSQHVVHSCGDDIYRGRILIASPDRWAEIWSVRGPRKRYRSITIYRRHGIASLDGDRPAKS
jgi:hypothetical protein